MDKASPQAWKDVAFKSPCKEKDFLLRHNNSMKQTNKQAHKTQSRRFYWVRYLFRCPSLVPNFRHAFLPALRTLALIAPKAQEHHKEEVNIKSVISSKDYRFCDLHF